MALATPEFLQTKTYSALRDRLMFQHGGPIQAGVWDTNDFKVVQRAAGANMSVDVGQGFALISANDPGNAGLYHEQNDATVNVASFASSNATLPRIDSVYVLINDSTHGGDANDTPSFGVATGTATAGATLDNRTGAGSLPTGSLLLADILVPAASTSIVTANIRDRRPWARGAFCLISATPGAPAALNQSNSTSPIDITNSGFQPRIECSGQLLRLNFNADVGNDTAGANVVLWPRQDSTFAPGVNSSPTYAPWHTQKLGAGAVQNLNGVYTYAPAAGSHLINIAFAAQTGGTAFIGTNGSTVQFTIEEIIRPNANNN